MKHSLAVSYKVKHTKTLMLRKIEGRRRRGWQRTTWLDVIANSMDIEHALGDGEGQGSLACCGPWGCKQLDMNERLNNDSNNNPMTQISFLVVCPGEMKGYVHTKTRTWRFTAGEFVSSVQLFSCVQLFATSRTAAHQTTLSITNSQSLLKLMSIESVMPSNYLILCHHLLLPSIFPRIRVVFNESVLRIRSMFAKVSEL